MDRKGIMPELSVVLATVNDSLACNLTCAHIIQQLESDSIDYEIILVDNNSLPEEKAILEQFLRYHKEFPIKYFNFDIQGTIPIHAFGIEKASGKYITMPEPHVLLTPHYYKIMLDKFKKLKSQGVEMLFSAFTTGTIARKEEDVIYGTVLLENTNPFERTGTSSGPIKTSVEPTLSGAFCAMICEKEWLIKIGNMFPDAFVRAGGYVAEAILLGTLTWMFGKKCYLLPSVLLEHPVYRIHKGPGRNENMYNSMAVGSYIIGGKDFLDRLPGRYGGYEDGIMEDVIKTSEYARKFVEENAKYTLKELLKNWNEIYK